MNFKPKKIAEAESQVWQAYYKKDSKSVLDGMKLFLKAQYKISDKLSERIAEKFVFATMKFAQMPQQSEPKEYDKDVLSYLVAAYQSLKDAIRGSWNAEEVAAADLSWWVARRQNDTQNPEIVAGKMANLFHLLYGIPENNSHLQRAAYLRSVAGRYRDQCQDAWGGVNAEDWTIVNLLLNKVYTELSQAL